MIGKVVSVKTEKTAVVSVTRTFMHPKARKYVRRSKRYMAHDEHGICNEGDEVLIEQCRPLSKHKRWRLRKVVRANA
jgi:small subunit ribosomal protein S17